MNFSSAEQTLETILQTYRVDSFLLTPDGVVVDYGSGGRPLPYAFLDAIYNKNIKDIFPADLVEKLEQALQAVGQTGTIISLEYTIPVSNRAYWFDARLIPVSDSRVMLVAHDITEYRETEMKLKQQMQQLSILRSIDLAIASGLDLSLLLSMLLDQVTMLVGADAATVFLLNPRNNLLEFASGKGFRFATLQHMHLKLGEEYAGRVALERTLVHIPDIRTDQIKFVRSSLFYQENFITYWAVPLIAKGWVLGVLEMFHRSPFTPDTNLRNFLATVAGQAAIAVDNAKMFGELQRSNMELSLAYDAAIEGLSHALDLRAKEDTEHTARVADMSVKLASRLGVEGAALIHVRRGAILHDVGKLAIPDQILFKPGPLIDEEWEIMRRHPELAVELLAPVSYLEQALEIPHWHHEKWNGTGYPDGLTREDIPLAARLFALADVYDALRSRRPYRPAWSKEDALQYLESEAGRHFDPKILPEFLGLIRGSSL